MLEITDTRHAPWYIVHSDDKKRARLNCISHLLSLIPYKRLKREKIELPDRDEKEAYETLRKHHVPSLPDLICGGKVLTDGVTAQVTQNQELATTPEPWRHPCRSDIRTYEHFRLLLEPLYPLHCLQSSKQVVVVLRDIAEGMCNSYSKYPSFLKMLHA